MAFVRLTTLFILALCPLGSGMAAEVNADPVEVVIVGRQTGPPLWKVSNGDKVLWIFPHLSWVPKGMIWESARVARVIAESQEVLSLPETGLKISALQRLNPFTVSSSLRNMKRMELNLNGDTLEANLPPELYTRFTALQTRYFPNNKHPKEIRPSWAGASLIKNIRKQEGLVPSDDILKTIRRLERRNRSIRHTEISVKVEFGNEYQERLMTVWESVNPEQEQACFERQVQYIEEDINKLKSLANNWAQGSIDGYRDIDEFHNASLWPYASLHACAELLMGSSSPEHEALVDMISRVNLMWLDAAENALATNASTFAILPINELIVENGLLSKLKAKGYEISEP